MADRAAHLDAAQGLCAVQVHAALARFGALLAVQARQLHRPVHPVSFSLLSLSLSCARALWVSGSLSLGRAPVLSGGARTAAAPAAPLRCLACLPVSLSVSLSVFSCVCRPVALRISSALRWRKSEAERREKGREGPATVVLSCGLAVSGRPGHHQGAPGAGSTRTVRPHSSRAKSSDQFVQAFRVDADLISGKWGKKPRKISRAWGVPVCGAVGTRNLRCCPFRSRHLRCRRQQRRWRSTLSATLSDHGATSGRSACRPGWRRCFLSLFLVLALSLCLPRSLCLSHPLCAHAVPRCAVPDHLEALLP